MSFIDHDLCRRCGTADGPSHTTAECERVRAQRAHDSSLPVVTRRADGKRFRIVLQARSPNGPVELLACDGPPFERVSTTNDRLLTDFSNPQKAETQPNRCGAAGPCSWMSAALLTNDGHAVNFARREMEHPDTFRRVTRYVASVNGERVVKIAACPACGGNPNEETVYR